MARAAVAAGADGLLVEVHPSPDRALVGRRAEPLPRAVRSHDEGDPAHRRGDRPPGGGAGGDPGMMAASADRPGWLSSPPRRLQAQDAGGSHRPCGAGLPVARQPSGRFRAGDRQSDDRQRGEQGYAGPGGRRPSWRCASPIRRVRRSSSTASTSGSTRRAPSPARWFGWQGAEWWAGLRLQPARLVARPAGRAIQGRRTCAANGIERSDHRRRRAGARGTGSSVHRSGDLARSGECPAPPPRDPRAIGATRTLQPDPDPGQCSRCRTDLHLQGSQPARGSSISRRRDPPSY